MEYKFVCVDSETTGLNDQQDEVIEVTAMEFNPGWPPQFGESYTTFCKPMSGFIPQEASNVNHITYDMVKNSLNYLQGGIRNELAKFINGRPIVGHNIIGFDLKFLKIIPERAIDTLQMCRAKFNGGNKLKSACIRMGIEWDDNQAHRSLYDVIKCIELYCKLQIMIDKDNVKKEQMPLFADPAPESIKAIYSAKNDIQLLNIDDSSEFKFGVIPSVKDKELLATQTYSFSRLNLFNQCPFKWYMVYIRGFKEPQKSYFQTGNICHKIAEWSGEWCYKKLFINKLLSYMEVIEFKMDNNVIKILSDKYGKKSEEITKYDFATYIYENQSVIYQYFPSSKNSSDLIEIIDNSINVDSYDKPIMPTLEEYNRIIDRAINFYKCIDSDVISEVKNIMNRFYSVKDFSSTPGDLILTEKKLVFDKDWNCLNDFYSDKAFFRAIMDVITYIKNEKHVIITDYKSSRKMLTAKELVEDKQMLIYTLLMYKFLPIDSYEKLTIRIEYIRYNQTIEYTISDIKTVVEKALNWIGMSIQSIEKEMIKTKNAFQPIRNEYCHTCFLGEDGMCPLFNKHISGNLEDPFSCSVNNQTECVAAWKRIETNKSETARLSKLCKTFLEQSTDPVIIDKNAKLDFYVNKIRDFNSKSTIELLLNKKLKLADIIRYFNISQSELEKLKTEHGIELTEEELNSISKVKNRTTFDAYTAPEAKAKGCINP